MLVVESAGFEIAGTADSGTSLLEITRTEKRLVVTDIRMPPTFTDEGWSPPSRSGAPSRRPRSSCSPSSSSAGMR